VQAAFGCSGCFSETTGLHRGRAHMARYNL
jgi:hypothetical protein